MTLVGFAATGGGSFRPSLFLKLSLILVKVDIPLDISQV